MTPPDWVALARAEARRRGDPELASLYRAVQEHGERLNYAGVDAAAAAALERVGSGGWPEIYFRHWQLTSRVVDRCEGEAALADCERLVGLARRAENRACPESLCAERDRLACLANIGGAATAEARIAEARALMARAGPSRACWTCLSGEIAEALLELGRPAELLAWPEAGDAGSGAPTPPPGPRAAALVQLGRAEEALALLDGATRPGGPAGEGLRLRLARAAALLALGRDQEARQALPSPTQILRYPAAGVDALRVWRALLERGAISMGPSWQRQATGLAMRLTERGARARAAEAWREVFHIARLRGRRAIASLAAHYLRQAVDGLPNSGTWHEELRRMYSLTAQIPLSARRPSASYEEQLDHRAAHPHHLRAQVECGFEAYARETVEALVEARPAEAESWAMLALLGRLTADTALLRRAAEGGRAAGATATALRAEVDLARLTGEPERGHAAATALRALEPDDPGHLLTQATFLRELGRWEEALGRILAYEVRVPGDSRAHVELLSVAPLAGRWDLVRQRWAQLTGLPMEGEGPLYTPGPAGTLRARSGEPYEVQRDGPCCATIVSSHSDPALDRFGERVVFHAIRERPHPWRRARRWLWLEVGVLHPRVHRRVLLDGVWPGREALSALADALRREGVHLFDLSKGRHTLRGPDGATHRRLTAVLEVPPALEDAALAAKLNGLAGDALIAWPGLARSLDDHATLDRQAARLARWGIDTGGWRGNDSGLL